MPAILCKNSGKDTPVILVWVSVDNNLLSTANPFSLNIQSVQQVNSPASTKEAPILYFYGFLPRTYNNCSIAFFDQANQLLRLVNTIKTIPNIIHQPLLNDHRVLSNPRPKLTIKVDRIRIPLTYKPFERDITYREHSSPKVLPEIKLRLAIFRKIDEMRRPLLSERRKREIEQFVTANDSSISSFYDIINEGYPFEKYMEAFEEQFSPAAKEKVKNWAMKNIRRFVSGPFLRTQNIIYTFELAGQAGKKALVTALGSDGIRKTVCAALSSISSCYDTWLEDNKQSLIDNLTTILCPKVFKNFYYEKQKKLFSILKEYQQPAYLHAQLHACYLRTIHDNEMSVINIDRPITREIPSRLISPGKAATIENLESYSRYKKAEGIARVFGMASRQAGENTQTHHISNLPLEILRVITAYTAEVQRSKVPFTWFDKPDCKPGK
ncbi:MAG: hypothetical protein VXW87_03180 [Pseudomonadota bacterium]|nr:hypothetical protein [Pseudomonadota bacterium]